MKTQLLKARAEHIDVYGEIDTLMLQIRLANIDATLKALDEPFYKRWWRAITGA